MNLYAVYKGPDFIQNIEADSEDQARSKAQDLGLDFDRAELIAMDKTERGE